MGQSWKSGSSEDQPEDGSHHKLRLIVEPAVYAEVASELTPQKVALFTWAAETTGIARRRTPDRDEMSAEISKLQAELATTRGEMEQAELIEWLFRCQHECGGFGGNEGHDPHMF